MSLDGTWGGGTPAGEPPSNDHTVGGPAPVAGSAPQPFGPQPFGPQPFGPPPFGAPGAGSPVLVPPAARPRQRPPVLIITAVVVVALVLVGVPVLVFALRSSGPSSPHRTAAGSTPSASPSPSPASPQQYQKVLDSFAQSLGPKFGALSSDRTPDQLRKDVADLQNELDVSLTILKAVAAPREAASAHDHLVTALSQLGQIVDQAVTDTASGELCGGSPALSRITTSPAAEAVRAAVKELSTADPTHPYTLAAFLPAGTPEATRQLGNGTVIKKSTKGPNTLKLEDQGDTDAVLGLVPSGTAAATLMVYVRAGATANVNGIKDGSYDIYVTSGHDWDGGAKAFTRDCRYEKFSEPAKFTSTRSTYTIETITLNATAGGNTSAVPTDPGTFPS